MNKKDIAVIGISCKFPQSEGAGAFWDNLRQGKELIHFFSPGELQDRGIKIKQPDDTGYVYAKSILEGKGSFDFSFFGYTRDEAIVMDPQIRLLHEYAWKALEDAGKDPYKYSGKIGFFAGVSDNINWMANNMITGGDDKVEPFYRNILSNKNFSNTLISYKLDLKGPSYFLNTACSSSLAAIHMACRNILLGECDMAIAGGARVSSSTTIGYTYVQGGIYSKDGHNRTFDHASSGTIEGDGIGVVVLKRMEDALKDGDHIYAVIKSSAVNNDGNRKVGYTAPSSVAQEECIRLSHRLAGVTPDSISYIEAHGTATRLGDPIEVGALNKVFGNNGKKYCAIGSVKSNLGHLDTAAGIAGFIKTVLALHYKEIPASLHFERPNPFIDFESGPFYVNTTLQKWKRSGDTPLRAGVSSFGIGGTNVHVVLEEAPDFLPPQEDASHQLLVLSAKTPEALTRNLSDLQKYNPDWMPPLADIAYTLQNRHLSFRYRYYSVCKEADGMPDSAFQGTIHDRGGTKKPIVVFMFSGQGGQYLDMARGLYDNIPFFRSIVDEGFLSLKNLTGTDYLEMIYGGKDPYREDLLNNTLHTQPLLFVFEYALARFLMELNMLPDLMIGHSIGELTAACISGVFSFQEGISIVTERARLMSSMPGGGMLSVGVNEATLLPLLNGDVSIAAINGPENCVISGTANGIEKMTDTLKEQGISSIRINTSHAFHSPMMEAVLEEFEEIMAAVDFSEPAIPIISNISGKLAGSEIMTGHYWARHIREVVRFADGISELAQAEQVIFLEIGPGSALTHSCRQICKTSNKGHVVLNLLRSFRDDHNDYALLLERLGKIWVNGIDIDFAKLHQPGTRRITSLPTYNFEKHDFPAEVDPVAAITHLMQNGAGSNQELCDWFYVPGWKRAILLDEAPPDFQFNHCMIFSDGGPMPTALKYFLSEKGLKVTEIQKGRAFAEVTSNLFIIDPASGEDYIKAGRAIASYGHTVDQVLYICTDADAEDLSKMDCTGPGSDFYCLLNLFKALLLQEAKSTMKLFFITDRLQHLLDPKEQESLSSAPALGILKVLSQENPDVFGCHLDLSFPSFRKEKESILRAIYDECRFNNGKDPIVLLRNATRWIPVYDQVRLDNRERPLPIQHGGTYLITGGLGQVGICLAGYLLKRYASKVILIGRTPTPDPDEKRRSDAGNLSVTERLASLHELEKLPGHVFYFPVDVSSYDSLLMLVEKVETLHGPIKGVIHAAGNTNPANFKPIELLGAKQTLAHVAPKIDGIINLSRIFENRNPDFVWVTSSIAAVLGGLTYGAYSAANLFMDYYISRNSLHERNWISVNLDGLNVGAANANAKGINEEALIGIFERSFKLMGNPSIVISTDDLVKRIDRYILKNRKDLRQVIQPAGEYSAPPGDHSGSIPATKLQGDNLLSPTEEKLLLIWQEFFGITTIGPYDDFFELGGDSLKAMNLARRIHREYNIDLPVALFFKNPCIRTLAEEMDVAMGLQLLDPENARLDPENANTKKRKEVKI